MSAQYRRRQGKARILRACSRPDERPAADKDRGGDVAGVGAVALLAAGGIFGRAVEVAEAVGGVMRIGGLAIRPAGLCL